MLTGQKTNLSPAMALIARLEDLELNRGALGNDALDRKLLEESLGLCDQALRIFRTENEAWLAAWTSLHKASLLTESARHVEPAVRMVHIRSAFELSQKALQGFSEVPSPDLKRLGKLTIVSLDVLLRIRSFLEDPGQLKVIDSLIRQVGSYLGEIQALDLTMRREAYDLLFSARMLESMVTFEEDPSRKAEMLRSSRKTTLDALSRLRISSPTDLEPLAGLLNELRETLSPPEKPHSSCPRCGAENNPGAAFCSQCGTTLLRSMVRPDVQPPHVCRRCSHVNREEALFCTYCGARLKREA